MPNITVPLLSIEASILNGIFFTVGYDLKKALRIEDQTKLYVYNSMGVAMTDMRSNARPSKKPDKNLGTLDSDRKFEVRVGKEFDENSLGTGYVTQLDVFPIFRDTHIGVSVTPIYGVEVINFEVTYTSPSKIEIDQIRSLLRTKLTRADDVVHHEFRYTMILPEFVEVFIEDVHALRNRLMPMDLIKYFDTMTTNRTHVISDYLHKDNSALGVREVVNGVYGEFEFRNAPPPTENNNDRNTHSITFSYQITLEIPSRVNCTFPVMICNRPMPNFYIDELTRQAQAEYDFYTNKRLHLGRSSSIMQEMFSGQSQLERTAVMTYPINVPPYDRYDGLAKNIKGYATVMTVLTEVEEDDKQLLFNLKDDLEEWYIPDEILEYLKGPGRRRAFHPYESFIYIALDQRGTSFNNNILEMDDDFNLYPTKPLDLTVPVRISIKVCIDLTFLTESGRKDLENNDVLLDMALEEYIELKDKVDNNDHLEEARIIHIVHLIIVKYDRYLSRGMCDRVRAVTAIIKKDRILASRLNDMLVRGYPRLAARIRRCGVILVEGGGIEFENDNTLEHERQTDSEIKNIIDKTGHLPKDEDGQVINREQLKARNGNLWAMSSRTVMNSSVVALRRE